MARDLNTLDLCGLLTFAAPERAMAEDVKNAMGRMSRVLSLPAAIQWRLRWLTL